MDKTIDRITLKGGRQIVDFPTIERRQREDQAKEFIETVNKDRLAKFDLVRQHLDNLRKEFQNKFHGQLSDADYYIFNSIKWE